jgi:hypothetical protein
MGVKTCLLCGKSLSRIWSGAGEDFCSREHRNQYRLRKGMDRLQEANKVANVMRRRENPRQIASRNLSNPGMQSPRAFMQPQPISARPDPALALPLAAMPFRPRLATHPGAIAPSALASAPAATREGATTAIRFPVPSKPVSSTRALAPRNRVGVSRASLVPVTGKTTDIEVSRRSLVSAWHCTTPTVIGDMLERIPPADLNPMDTARSARRLFVPSQGRALRVSLGIGFPVTKGGVPKLEIGQPEAAGMTWPVMINFSEAPLDRGLHTPAMAAFPISVPGMRIPAAPPSNLDGQFRWPGVFELPLHFVSPAIRHRTAFVPFGNTDEGSGKERLYEYRN